MLGGSQGYSSTPAVHGFEAKIRPNQAGDGRLLVLHAAAAAAALARLTWSILTSLGSCIPDDGNSLRVSDRVAPVDHEASICMTRLLVILFAGATLVVATTAHEHHGEAPTCAGGSEHVLAEFRPGEVTVDGHNEDWESVEASEFALLPALDPDDDKAYSGGKIAVKVRLFHALFFVFSFSVLLSPIAKQVDHDKLGWSELDSELRVLSKWGSISRNMDF